MLLQPVPLSHVAGSQAGGVDGVNIRAALEQQLDQVGTTLICRPERANSIGNKARLIRSASLENEQRHQVEPADLQSDGPMQCGAAYNNKAHQEGQSVRVSLTIQLPSMQSLDVSRASLTVVIRSIQRARS